MRVRGSGPTPAPACLIGEAPGAKESQTGQCFVGKSGQEMDRYLWRAGLPREECYVTNLVKLQPPVVNGKQQPPTKEDIARDESELFGELAAAQAGWIGAVGRYSARWFLGDVDMEQAHGLAFPIPQDRIADFCERAGEALRDVLGETLSRALVVPIYHPAAGLHNSELQQLIHEDFEQFAGYVRGRLRPVVPVDEFPDPDYREDRYGIGGHINGRVAVDTEGLLGNAWGLSFSQLGGSSTVVRAVSTRALAGAKRLIESQPVILHNALHDLPILREMGINVDTSTLDDTMVMAYVLRTMPQGLKALARRLCGMSMMSYMDVIGPAEQKRSLEYIRTALDARQCEMCEGTGKVLAVGKSGKVLKHPVKCTWENENGKCLDGAMWPPSPEWWEWDFKTGGVKFHHPHSISKYLQRLQKDINSGVFEIDEDTGERVSPRTRWLKIDEDIRRPVEDVIGPMPEAGLDDVEPEEVAVNYSARDADATYRIYAILSDRIDALDLRDAYRLDMSVVPMADRMQGTGMRIDRPYFAALTERLREEKLDLLDKLERHVGHRINPGSGDQVAALLFGERHLTFDPSDSDFADAGYSFQLTGEKKTRSGKRESVDDKVLEGLKLKYSGREEVVQAIDYILKYRVRDKLEGTYARKLPKMADSSDRVHTRIKLTRTETARWASSDPNLQNIPIREKAGEELGKLIRMGFVAEPGYTMGSWDYDQIELRVIAHYSHDSTMLDAFRTGKDPHIMGASVLMNRDYDELYRLIKVEKEPRAVAMRLSIKNLNFGIPYGISARALKAQFELRGEIRSIDECQHQIDSYFERHPGIKGFIEDAHTEARRTGMVRSMFGHIRYCPGVWSPIPSVREEALRQAANFKIQCTAAELMKLGMKSLWEEGRPAFEDHGFDVRWLMAVHDEMLLELPEDEDVMAYTNAIVVNCMSNPVQLAVPVTVEGKFDRAWGLLK
jgi:uracil-DNA glycosylase family 4